MYIYNCIDSFWYDEYLNLVVYIYIYTSHHGLQTFEE